MARDKRKGRKPKPKKPPKGKKPPPQQQQPSTTESLKELSTQSGPEAMAQTPTQTPAEATAAAVYSTGPGSVVAYQYERTGTYADVYNQQQATTVQGENVVSAQPTAAAMGG